MRFSMLRSLALGCAACVLLACGSESGLEGTGSAWQDPAEAVSGVNRKPVIESVRLLPAEPAPGDRLEAIVRASDLATTGQLPALGPRLVIAALIVFGLPIAERYIRLPSGEITVLCGRPPVLILATTFFSRPSTTHHCPSLQGT